MTFERYRESVRYLVEDLWHGSPSSPRGDDPQERIRALLAELGNPHEAFPVIHVGGTTGKGSTAAMTAAILEEAGLRVGLYVSPFLQTFVERISVNGLLMASDQFGEAIEAIKPVVGRMAERKPTILEVLFAIGMQHFQREKVDVAVVEVGLGGRTDCTNVFEPSAVSVITNVQLDHTRQLGSTPAAIAGEKAAIIKSGTLAVTGATGEALRVIEQRCREAGVALWRAGHEIEVAERGCDVQVTTPRRRIEVSPAMSGRHQRGNAALAVAAVDAFASATGMKVDDAAVAAGIARARQPGRMEVVQQRPRVILDAAHNPAAAEVLAAALEEKRRECGGRLLLLIGILADKDRDGILSRLVPLADRVVVTKPPLDERAGDPSDVVASAERQAEDGIVVELREDPREALELVLAMASAEDTVCVTGSIYLIGLLRNYWFPEERLLSERRISYAAL